MSRSYWRAICVACGILILVSGAPYAAQQPSPAVEQANQQATQDKASKNGTGNNDGDPSEVDSRVVIRFDLLGSDPNRHDLAPRNGFFSGIINQPEDPVQSQRETDDLRAQQQMARAGWWMTWFAGGTLILTGIGIGLLWLTLREAQNTTVAAITSIRETERATAVTRKASEDALRPYVHISGAGFLWHGKMVDIILDCTNGGQTPAKFFEIKFSSRVIPRNAKRDFSLPANAKVLAWSTLGGNSSDTVGLRDEKFFEDALDFFKTEGKANFFVFGVVRYGDVFGAEYETEFAYFTPTMKEMGDLDPPRKMSRAPGKFRAFVQVKEPNQER